MHILVTAGPTREYFDSVRFISNPSSGKMGYAIAAEAARRDHCVVLISGPATLAAPPGVELVRVQSAEEMFEASVAAFRKCRCAVMTAAVCDYRPAERLALKLKKEAKRRDISLVPTKDICAHLGGIKADRVVIGFAMEDHDPRIHAEAKLAKKNCDAIVLNGIDNVGSDEARIEILRVDSGWSGPFSGSKAQVASVVVDLVDSLAGGRSG